MAALAQTDVHTLLAYDPATGIFMRKGTSSIRQTQAGKQAGCVDSSGYRAIRVGKGRRILAHRLAWFYTYGYWPKELDHINGDKDDNRISNLREATRSQNMANVGTPKHNKSGIKGVIFDKANSRWMAYMQVNGRFKNLGRFDDRDSAIQARQAAFRKAFDGFARECR